MPGTYMKPKAYNRHFALNLGTDASPEWAEISVGISSRGNSFTENTEDFYYMNNKGTAETGSSEIRRRMQYLLIGFMIWIIGKQNIWNGMTTIQKGKRMGTRENVQLRYLMTAAETLLAERRLVLDFLSMESRWQAL